MKHDFLSKLTQDCQTQHPTLCWCGPRTHCGFLQPQPQHRGNCFLGADRATMGTLVRPNCSVSCFFLGDWWAPSSSFLHLYRL